MNQKFQFLIFTLDLVLQPTRTNLSYDTSSPKGEQLCQIILKSMHNVRVMARTSSIHDHFIIKPSSVSLTVKVPEQMFQIVLLLVKENNCAKLLRR